MKKLKIVYRRNLNMSPGKLAAQAVHAAIAIGASDAGMSVAVIGLRDKQYYETIRKINTDKIAIVKDAGITEVPPGTETCAAWYEQL